jgi:hypothetical protein
VQVIQSNEYFDTVQEYFAEHKMPSRVYKFLLDMLREDEYKLSDDLLYQSVIHLKRQKIAFVSALESVFLCCALSRKNEILNFFLRRLWFQLFREKKDVFNIC